MTSPEQCGRLADELRRMLAYLEKATTSLSEFHQVSWQRRTDEPQSLRSALEANARPVHRPQQQRRFRRSQHR
ncbi:hypothetical protein [Deinococcus frigens]|uniref:hypothetical protein n=1 Tax=Deinococcus frigens TaxID=249403 RepID=UPI00054DFE97|nr:hypothetical protein [Deinococcus frigens]